MNKSVVDPEAEIDSDLPISRSQAKRDAQALFRLGQLLVELPLGDLEQMPVPGGVREAIDAARNIKSHGARKRQLLFVAKKLRATDTDALKAAVDDHLASKTADRQVHARVERWRDFILEQGLTAINQLAASHPGFDRQRLRSLVRKAGAQRAREQPPAAARKLFRELRQLDDQHPLPESPGD